MKISIGRGGRVTKHDLRSVMVSGDEQSALLIGLASAAVRATVIYFILLLVCLFVVLASLYRDGMSFALLTNAGIFILLLWLSKRITTKLGKLIRQVGAWQKL